MKKYLALGVALIMVLSFCSALYAESSFERFLRGDSEDNLFILNVGVDKLIAIESAPTFPVIGTPKDLEIGIGTRPQIDDLTHGPVELSFRFKCR